MRRAQPATQTGTSAPVARAASMTAGPSSGMSLRRARRRRAAAASAEPPPMPAAAGSRLTRWKRPARSPASRSSRWRAAVSDEICLGRPRRRGGRPLDGQRQPRAGDQGQRVAGAGERDQAFELVIAVGPPSEDVEGEVDLGGRPGREEPIGQRRLYPPFFLISARSVSAAAGLSCSMPFSSLSTILARSSGSGFESLACCHWNRASSLRPTRQ